MTMTRPPPFSKANRDTGNAGDYKVPEGELAAW